MKSDIAAALLEHWSHSQINLSPPATPAGLDKFDEQFGLRFPDELRQFYLSVNGFAPPRDQDAKGFSFWPLERICRVASFDDRQSASDGTANCFVFADYLSLSWAYAFCLVPNALQARVCVVGTADGRPIWIADSFREFVELYLRDDSRLYVGGASQPAPSPTDQG